MSNFNKTKSSNWFLFFLLGIFSLFFILSSCSLNENQKENYLQAIFFNNQDSLEFFSSEPSKYYSPETGYLSIYFETVSLESGLYLTIESGAKVATLN